MLHSSPSNKPILKSMSSDSIFSKGRSFLSWITKPRTKFSLERYTHCLTTLSKLQPSNPNNANTIIEYLKDFTEITIWGDKNNPNIFDAFMENGAFNILYNLLRCSTNPKIISQFIQSFTILMQFITQQNSLCTSDSTFHCI